MSTPGFVFLCFIISWGEKKNKKHLISWRAKIGWLPTSSRDIEDVPLQESLPEQLRSMELPRPWDPVKGLKSGYIFLADLWSEFLIYWILPTPFFFFYCFIILKECFVIIGCRPECSWRCTFFFLYNNDEVDQKKKKKDVGKVSCDLKMHFVGNR